MTELKTLKDFMKDEMPVHDNCLLRLKCTAIEDIKQIQKEMEHGISNPNIHGDRLNINDFRRFAIEREAVIEYIKWKFNISEEELNKMKEKERIIKRTPTIIGFSLLENNDNKNAITLLEELHDKIKEINSEDIRMYRNYDRGNREYKILIWK